MKGAPAMFKNSGTQSLRMSFVTFICSLGALTLVGCSGSSSVFQNESDQTKSATPNSSGGGNGDYYGGKPQPGTYSRVGGFTACPGSPMVTEQIQVNSESAVLSKRDPKTCRTTRTEIKFEELEFANYEPGRVGRKDGIYVKSGDWQSQGVNEAWCRREGSNSRIGYDVIIIANYPVRQFAAKVADSQLLANGESQLRDYFVSQISREVQMDERLRYRGDKFELEVDLRAFNSVTGKFKSAVKFEASGIDVSTSVECRLSGELDASRSGAE